MTADCALPDHVARRPVRHQRHRLTERTIGTDEADGDAVALAPDFERDFVAIQPDRTATFTRYGTTIHLTGNLPLALTENMIDGSSHRGDAKRHVAFRRARTKPLGKFLGDEAGRQIALRASADGSSAPTGTECCAGCRRCRRRRAHATAPRWRRHVTARASRAWRSSDRSRSRSRRPPARRCRCAA